MKKLKYKIHTTKYIHFRKHIYILSYTVHKIEYNQNK